MIRVDHDHDAAATYITVAPAPAHRTREINSTTMVDLDHDGNLVGIEILGRGQQWPVDQIITEYPLSDWDAAQLRALAEAW